MGTIRLVQTRFIEHVLFNYLYHNMLTKFCILLYLLAFRSHGNDCMCEME